MAKSTLLFFGGIVLCFVMIKALGNTEPIQNNSSSKLQAKIDQLISRDNVQQKKIEALEKAIKKAKDQLSAPVKAPVVEDGALPTIDITTIEKMIDEKVAAKVAESSSENIAEKLGNMDTEKVIESVASNFQEIMAKRVKNSLLKDIELTEDQKKELDTIFAEHQESMGGIRDVIDERLSEDATREERREAWREELTKLREESNEKVRKVMNDETKYEQYQKNSQNSWGGWVGGRRGGR